MTKRVRKDPEQRAGEIFDAAWSITVKQGLKKATRSAVAAAAGASQALVSLYFGNREELRGALIEHAVKTKEARVIRQAIDMGYEVQAPRDLMRAANAL